MLLRFLEAGEIQAVGASRPERVDTRVLTATHRDLAARALDGRFREDLYERLAWAVLVVPPLRNRLDDLPLLVEHFRRCHNAAFGFAVAGVTTAALERLAAWPWRGNVRALLRRRRTLPPGASWRSRSPPTARASAVASWPPPAASPPSTRDGSSWPSWDEASSSGSALGGARATFGHRKPPG